LRVNAANFRLNIRHLAQCGLFATTPDIHRKIVAAAFGSASSSTSKKRQIDASGRRRVGPVIMKKTSLSATTLFACLGLLFATSDHSTAQSAGADADSARQELAQKNTTLRRQNAELLERLRRLEAKKGVASSATGDQPRDAAASAMAASYPVKAPLARPADPLRASGYLEAYTGGAWTKDSGGDPFDPFDLKYGGWVVGGAGRGNWWATPNISVQLDAQAEGTKYKVPSELLAPGLSGQFSTLSYLIAAHANWRDPRTGLIGIVGGIGDAGGNDATNPSLGNSGVRHGLIGLEGQYYLNALTLYGQGGYDSTFKDIGGFGFFNNAHAWYLRGTGRYFFMPNFMVEGTAQYAKGEIGINPSIITTPDTDFKTWLWRIKGEWRPGQLPVSFFVTYQGSRTNYDANPTLFTFGERVTDNRVMAGLRLYLGGQDTLLTNDRTGATLDVIDPLGSPASPFMLLPLGELPATSDIRLKRDIALVGRLDNGLGLYRYRYLWSDTVYVGVMAQEVAFTRPDAVVVGPDGYLRVKYGRLGLHLMTLPEWSALSEGRSAPTPVSVNGGRL
jgi:hypothetical protein